MIEHRFKGKAENSESTADDPCSTDYEHKTSDEGDTERKCLFVKRKREDTECTSDSIRYENSHGSDHYRTHNDPTEGGRLYRMAEGKVVYFGEATLTTYENMSEGITDRKSTRLNSSHWE